MKKRLLLITNGFPFGESERSFLSTEFAYLTKAFQVRVLACGSDPLIYPFPQNVQAEHYDYSPIRHPKRLSSYLQILLHPLYPSVMKDLYHASKHCPPALFKTRVLEILAYSIMAWQLESRLRSIVEEDKIDIIYTFWCTPATVSALRVKKSFPHLKVVTRFHGYDLYRERQPSGWQPLRQMISEQCDRLLFVSDISKSYYLEHWGEQWASKSVVSYLGCRQMDEVPASPSESIILVSCAYMVPLKRISYIIDALAQLPSTFKVEWHHIGGGEEMQFLTERATKLLLPHSNIRWKYWGDIPNIQLNSLYRQIQPDVFITTSSTEGMPVSLLEAFSMGIPAIATAVGGIPELVHDGETGFLLSENPSIEEVASAIIRFYESTPAQKSAMRAAAKALWKETFDADKNAKQFVRLLEEVTLTSNDQGEGL